MLSVIAFALAVGLLGAWVYAGCPLPPRPAVRRKPGAGDGAVKSRAGGGCFDSAALSFLARAGTPAPYRGRSPHVPGE